MEKRPGSRLEYRQQRSNTHLEDVINQRISRRGAMKGLVAASAAVSTLGGSQVLAENSQGGPSTLSFMEVEHKIDEDHEVSAGYDATAIVRWGDAIINGGPSSDFKTFDAKDQLKQFGYNNDFIAFLPLPLNSRSSDHGLLCVNHEYISLEIMLPKELREAKDAETLKARVDYEMAAHGHSVVEIKRVDGRWKVINGQYNRRISALETEMRMSGPVAGHPRLKGISNPSGYEVVGTINNCAGGVTPWGTVLIAEENFHSYFGGDPNGSDEAANHADYGVGSDSGYDWYKLYDRYDVSKDPNGPNNFGWIVEFDPYDPTSRPVKRTALGRVRHEGATTALSADGRLVLYSGDDSRGEYMYKFVTEKKCHPTNRWENRDLLDTGTLYVAKFHDDGRLQWLPLVCGTGELTFENGFFSQADVLIDTRRSADLVGATPMDRPEDAETNPKTGRVYVMLTNNTNREDDQTDAANPRPQNKHGHIIEMIPPVVGNDVDHAATEFRWEMLLMGGDPEDADDGAQYHEQVSRHGWLSCPDNCAFDNEGRIWISTDGASYATQKDGEAVQLADGVYAADTNGPGRALTRQFFRGPIGAEICGPCFTPDNTTMFLAIQHPAEGEHLDGSESTFENPSTRWPSHREGEPPRPSVVAVTRKDGGVIGT